MTFFIPIDVIQMLNEEMCPIVSVIPHPVKISLFFVKNSNTMKQKKKQSVGPHT